MPSESNFPRAVVVIPARLQSTRLPQKLLLSKTGQTLIQHTYQSACQSELASEVVVATDSKKIFECVESFGGQAVMTRVDHPSGSSRVAEVASELDYPIVVNVQGDEPEISAEAIDAAIRSLAENPEVVVSTLACGIRDRSQLDDPSVVKVVFDGHGRALYFSRSPIPCAREWDDEFLQSDPPTFYQHIGLYAYRADFLPKFSQLPASQKEAVESLEQLKILDAGYAIQVGIVDHVATGIDTFADYEAFVRRMKS